MTVSDLPRTGGRGERTAMAGAARALAQSFPDEMRAELMSDRFRLRFLSSLEAGVGQCDRTCMRLYAEAVKLVGSQLELSEAIAAALGVGIAVARANTETVQRAGALDPAGKARLWAQSLERYCREHGIEGLSIPSEVLGSHAEVLENGTGLALNGTAGGSAHEKL